MGTAQTSPSGPDLTQGVPVDRLSDGRMLAGHVGEEVVLLVQRGNDFFAVGATCTHYGGPLADGLGGGDTRPGARPSGPFRPEDAAALPPPRLRTLARLK